MNALVLRQKNKWPKWEDFSLKPKKDLVRVDIVASALNHRDVWIVKGMYPGIKYPAILGSDGCGYCDTQRVIINPNIDWGERDDFQSSSYHILGMPNYGTFSEYVYVHPDRLYEAPGHLSDVEAAALPIAGLTAFRALITKGEVSPSSKVLINGIGGGVALMAFLFAKAIGCEVYITSSDARKRQKAIKYGATGAVNYRQEGWGKALFQSTGGMDVVIDSAGGLGFNELTDVITPGGRIVLYGGGQGPIHGLSPQIIFWKQISILGTSMGSDLEFRLMIDFVNRHKIKPILDEVMPIEQGEQGFIKLDKAKQFGKIVFNHKA